MRPIFGKVSVMEGGSIEIVSGFETGNAGKAEAGTVILEGIRPYRAEVRRLVSLDERDAIRKPEHRLNFLSSVDSAITATGTKGHPPLSFPT